MKRALRAVTWIVFVLAGYAFGRYVRWDRETFDEQS